MSDDPIGLDSPVLHGERYHVEDLAVDAIRTLFRPNAGAVRQRCTAPYSGCGENAIALAVESWRRIHQ